MMVDALHMTDVQRVVKCIMTFVMIKKILMYFGTVKKSCHSRVLQVSWDQDKDR